MLGADLRSSVAAGLSTSSSRVQRDAPALQQALVGRIAHQRVLEQIGGVWRRAAAEDQLGLDQPAIASASSASGSRRQAADHGMIEAAADDRGRLRHLLHRCSRSSRAISESCSVVGTARALERPVEVIGVRLPRAARPIRAPPWSSPRRTAARRRFARRSRRAETSGRRLPRVMRSTMACVAARASRFNASRVTTGWLAKACHECRPRGDQHADAASCDAIQRELDQLQRGRVDPVRVLDHP